MNFPFEIEVCVDSLESALSAEAGGADRVELCANLAEGGTTPGIGLVRLCVERLNIPTMVMIRPRGGDFHYPDLEFETMLKEVEAVRQAGAYGVVIGILKSDGRVDLARTRRLVEAARFPLFGQPEKPEDSLSITFHRAIDVCREPLAAVKELGEIGVNRILSSGLKATAWEGRATLKEMQEAAGEKIQIMAGAGVRPENVAELARETGIRSFHFSAFKEIPSPMKFKNPAVCFAGQFREEFVITQGDPERVRSVRKILEELEG